MPCFHVFYTSDKGYLMPTFVSICSMYAHASHRREIVVHVLDCGIPDDAWEKFSQDLLRLFPDVMPVKRERVEMSQFSGCVPYGGSLATYARILPSSLISDDWCLFSDGDILFIDDVLKLRACEDDSKIVIGHQDYDVEEFFSKWNNDKSAWYSQNGIEWDPGQFVCMGFVLMNLKRMRDIEFIEKCCSSFRRFTNSSSADQETINAVCRGWIGYLPEEWGAFNLCLCDEDFRPSVIHYTYSKPWKVGCSWTRALPDADRLWLQYAQHVARIPWARCAQANRATYFKKRIVTELYRMVFLVFGKRLTASKYKTFRRMLSSGRVWRVLIRNMHMRRRG